MRNTKIALAVLALVASTAAMANGATIYGTLEAGVANTSSSNNTTSGTSFAGTGSWVGGNNIGFKGSEDLDGGLKATYQLEMGINLNTGASDNGGSGTATSQTVPVPASPNFTSSSSLFSRTATIGLSGDFGSVTLGQQLSPYIAAQAAGTAGNGNFFVNRIIMGGGLGNAAVGSTVLGQGGFFMPNAIVYATPSIGGISASIMKTVRNGAAGGGIDFGTQADNYTAGMATGSFGDVNVTVGYQDRQNTIKGMTGSVSYTMGAATLSGNYTKSTIEAATAINSYSGSLAYKVTEPLTLSLQYARNNLANAQTLSNVGAQYALSKRTSVYATYGRGTNGAQSNYDTRGSYAATGVTTTSTTMAAGVIHSF
jgi:predicted porin